MSIIRPRVWTQQPQVPVEVDWNNTILSKITSIWRTDATNSYNDLIGTNHGTASAVLGLKPTRFGVGKAFSGAQYINCGNGSSVHPTELTMLSVFFISSTTGTQELLSTHNSGTGYAIEIASGIPKALVGTTSGWITSGATSVDVGSSHVAIARASAVGKYVSLTLDGVTATSGTYAGTYNNNSQQLWIGGAQAYGNYFNGAILLTALWNRAISASEVKTLSDNPWQIFRPRVT